MLLILVASGIVEVEIRTFSINHVISKDNVLKGCVDL